MASTLQQQTDYIKKMIPWAKKAESMVNLPYYFIVAQWTWETDSGQNKGSRELNNHAGIKFSEYAPKGTTKNGMYASYPTMDLYLQDYKRVMNLSYYNKVRSAKTDLDRINEMNASPWAEHDYNVNTIIKYQDIAKQYGGGISSAAPTTPAAPAAPAANWKVPSINDLDQSGIEEWAIIGLAFSAFILMLPNRSN